MDNKTLSLNYIAKPISFEKINDEFSLMKCYILGIGKNRNFSYIGKDAVIEALPSLYNTPVVGHLIKKDDGTYYVGGHDRQIIIEDKNITVNDLTVPFGVVPANDNEPEFVEVTESDGTIVEYLVANIILWTGRYGEILEATYSEEIYFGQSMEINPINVSKLKDDKNYVDIKSFKFSALCLLGRSDNPELHTEPCFPSSRVEPIDYSINKDNFKNEFSLMMGQLKELAFSFENKNKEEGGNFNMDEKNKLIQEYGLRIEEVNFEFENLTLEEFKIQLDEFIANSKENGKEPDIATFSATYIQKRDALRNALDPIIVKDNDDKLIEETYFWVNDFDDEYVYVGKDYWTTGNYECTHGRFTYTFDETTLVATLTSEFEQMILTWLTVEENQKIQDERATFETLQTEFDTYKSTYTTPDSEVQELKTFKKEKLDAEHKFAIEEVLSEFEDLSANEDFIALQENALTFSIEDLERECLVIRGKMAKPTFTKKDSTQKVKFSFTKETGEENLPYGDINKYIKQ